MTYLDTPPVDYPRYARPIPAEHLRSIFGDPPVDLFDQLGNREWHRRSTLDRVADALGSRDFLLVYMGIVGGALLTVGCAFLWSVGL
jgi:hypothetical protein